MTPIVDTFSILCREVGLVSAVVAVQIMRTLVDVGRCFGIVGFMLLCCVSVCDFVIYWICIWHVIVDELRLWIMWCVDVAVWPCGLETCNVTQVVLCLVIWYDCLLAFVYQNLFPLSGLTHFVQVTLNLVVLELMVSKYPGTWSGEGTWVGVASVIFILTAGEGPMWRAGKPTTWWI